MTLYKVDNMTTPDEEITGYGGQARTGSMQSPGSSSGPTTTSQTGSSAGSASGSASGPTTTSQTGSSAGGASGSTSQPGEEVKAKAREATEQVKNQGKAQLDSYRSSAADELEKVAQGARAAAAELENQDRSGLSHYVSDVAQGMVDFADNLRGKSVDELVGEVNRMARNNPALFIAGSIALGFGLTRFARASSHRSESLGREPTHDYGHANVSRGHPTSPLGVPADVTAPPLPSQAELDSHISSGVSGGSVGSVSNANMPSTPGSGTVHGGNGKGTTGGLNR